MRGGMAEPACRIVRTFPGACARSAPQTGPTPVGAGLLAKAVDKWQMRRLTQPVRQQAGSYSSGCVFQPLTFPPTLPSIEYQAEP